MNSSPPGSSIHGSSRQEYWSGLPFPPRGHLPDPEIKAGSPALADRFFTVWDTREAQEKHVVKHKMITAGHKEQISQVNDFSAFLNRRRCKNLGPLKLFLGVHLHDWYLRAGVSKHRVLLVSSRSCVPLRCTVGGQLCCPMAWSLRTGMSGNNSFSLQS